MGHDGKDASKPASITIHEDTVLIARTDARTWTLDAITASTGKRRWTHRIDPSMVQGFGGGRAETGPVVVGTGAKAVVLVKDYSMCDGQGNCSYTWTRYGITALSLADGTVAWSTFSQDDPARLNDPQQPRYYGVRLTGASDAVAVMSLALGSERVPTTRWPAALVGVDTATGRVLWTTRKLWGAYVAGETVIAGEVARLDQLAKPQFTGTVVAIDIRTGAERWRSSGRALDAVGGSRDLVLAKDPAVAVDENTRWTLLAVADGTVRVGDQDLGQCAAGTRMIACARDRELNVYTGPAAAVTTREFPTGTPYVRGPVGDLMSIRSPSGNDRPKAYAAAPDGTLRAGTLPGPIVALSERYAVLDLSDTTDRMAVYGVRR